MKIEEGAVVTVVLQNPHEKIWGVLREINPAGVFVRGIDLNIFDDFVRAIANEETFYGLGELFSRSNGSRKSSETSRTAMFRRSANSLNDARGNTSANFSYKFFCFRRRMKFAAKLVMMKASIFISH